jgi:thioredoxin-like negative regulator of GroEL
MLQQVPHHDVTPVTILHFAIPELEASRSMGETARQLSDEIGATFATIDVWTDHDAVIAGRVRFGPAILVLVDGQEVARLEGPRNRRALHRFATRMTDTITPSIRAA